MKIETFFFNQKNGWVEPLPAGLDSEKTLVIVFGATAYLRNLKPFNDLINHFPQSKIIGCSTAGEILGRTISDETLVGAVLKFEETSLETSFAPIQSANESFQAGEEIACRLMKPDLKGILILSD